MASEENKIHLDRMYKEAFQPFSVEKGTVYPSSQADIDFHSRPHSKTYNRNPSVTPLKATAFIMHHNKESREVPPAEKEAIGRLLEVIHLEEGLKYGPDLAVKAFADLDLVFFGGYLKGNTCVIWKSDKSLWPREVLGLSRRGFTDFLERNNVRIFLNADYILHPTEPGSPLQMMIQTLLHEMCQAYSMIRCPWKHCKHDDHFGSRISVIHKRAMRILGLGAIGSWQTYSMWHCYVDKNEGSTSGDSESHDARDSRGRGDGLGMSRHESVMAGPRCVTM